MEIGMKWTWLLKADLSWLLLLLLLLISLWSWALLIALLSLLLLLALGKLTIWLGRGVSMWGLRC